MLIHCPLPPPPPPAASSSRLRPNETACPANKRALNSFTTASLDLPPPPPPPPPLRFRFPATCADRLRLPHYRHERRSSPLRVLLRTPCRPAEAARGHAPPLFNGQLARRDFGHTRLFSLSTVGRYANALPSVWLPAGRSVGRTSRQRRMSRSKEYASDARIYSYVVRRALASAGGLVGIFSPPPPWLLRLCILRGVRPRP